jgi:hypothetical protein
MPDKDVGTPAPRNSNQQLAVTVNQINEIQTGEDEDKDPDEKDILHGTKLFLALVAMILSLFLFSIDVVSSSYRLLSCSIKTHCYPRPEHGFSNRQS